MNTKKKDYNRRIAIDLNDEQYNLLQQHCLSNKLTKAEVVRKLIESLIEVKINSITDWVDPSCPKEIPSEKVDVYLEVMEYGNAAELKLKEQQLREEELEANLKSFCSKGKEYVETHGINYDVICSKYN